jgi:hypothetical protein
LLHITFGVYLLLSCLLKYGKKRGRPKGSKNKVKPEVTKKLGDATLHYAHGNYPEVFSVILDHILPS